MRLKKEMQQRVQNNYCKQRHGKMQSFTITATSHLLPTWAVGYLCKLAPMEEFKCAPFRIILILDIGTIFMKEKP